MSDATTWNADKIEVVHERLTTYQNAKRALTMLADPTATAAVTLIVSTTTGGATFSFDLVVPQAIQFFQPIVDAIGADLTTQGVDLAPTSP